MKQTVFQFVNRETAIISNEVFPHQVLQEQRLAERNFLSALSRVVDHYLRNRNKDSGRLKKDG
jgi:hypothetical protein